jgi:hypothetical protein
MPLLDYSRWELALLLELTSHGTNFISGETIGDLPKRLLFSGKTCERNHDWTS